MTSGDLGVLENLAKALGAFDANGGPDPGWFGDPGTRLSRMLAADEQRDALVAFLDEVLDDGDVEHDTSGRSFVPLVTSSDPDVLVGAYVAPAATTVDVGVFATLATAAGAGRPETSTRLEVPLFRTRRGTAPAVADPILLGKPGGRIRLSSTVTLDGAAPVPGAFHLGSIGVTLEVPTVVTGDGAPVIGLSLGQLQLPGGSPRDFSFSADSADDLDDVVLELVLGLVQAQAGSAGGVVGALAGLLGLTPGVQPLPVDDLLERGVRALTEWLQSVLDDATGRAVWLGHLATLLGGAPNARGDGVTFDFGIAEVTVGVRTTRNSTGQVTVVPFVEATVGDPAQHVVVQLDLLASNLTTGATLALPRFSLAAHLGRRAGGTQPVVLDVPSAAPAPAVIVEAIRVGLALDENRRPILVVAADRVTIGDQDFPTLDLTSTDALMDAAGAAVDSVVDGLIARLGPFAQAAEVLFGLTPPPGHPAVPTIGLPDLARDPLGAVCGYWSTLITSHAGAVPDVLDVLRATLASTSAATIVRGSGTPSDPWFVPLAADVGLAAHLAGGVLHLAAAATTRVDTLGERCTVIEGDLRLELVRIDLAARSARVGTELSVTLRMRGRGLTPPQAILDLDVATITADRVAIALAWSPATGVRFGVDAPNAAITIGEAPPLALPPLTGLDPAALDAVAWDALELLIGQLAPMASTWIADTVGVLGWGGAGPRVRLADLVGAGADPVTALRDWLVAALVERGGRVLAFLADAIGGQGELVGGLVGEGTAESPFTIALGTGGPELLAWFPPAGPAPTFSQVDDRIRLWRPGDESLPSEELAAALTADAALAGDIADLIWNRQVAGGIDALVDRWAGSDGVIVPPATPPPGVDVVELPELAAGQLPGALDIVGLVGRDPSVVVHVAVGAGVDETWPDADPIRRISLVEPNRQPETFAPAVTGAGEWFVALGTRAACRLAAGDPDGTLGQAARLGRVLDGLAAAGAGAGQVLVGHGAAGQACRLAAAAHATVADLITTGTPLGPVSLAVLDERDAGDTWRLLAALAGSDDDADDDLARGRALLDAFAAVDRLVDPAQELRPPAGGVPTRAGLTHRAVFGIVSAEAVRRSITAVVIAGLARRATARAEEAGEELAFAPGVRHGLRLPIRVDAGPLVVAGWATVDMGGWDVATGAVVPAADRAVRLTLRVGASDGWLAGGPDPARGPTRPRDHGLRALAVDLVLPRGTGSTAQPSARVTLLDGIAFGVHRGRWELTPIGEPIAAEARLLLSLAVGRIVAEATAPAPAPAAVHLRGVLDALGLIAADGSVADAVESLIHQPALLVTGALASAATRANLAAAIRGLVGARPMTDPERIEIAGSLATTTIDLAARTIALDAPDGGGRFGWSAHASFAPGGLAPNDDWYVRIGADGSDSPAGAAWFELDGAGARLRWRLAGDTVPRTLEVLPTLDPSAAGAALTELLPALFGQAALELLRDIDESARPVIDAGLDAIGLLDRSVPDRPRVRLPLGLVTRPAAWLAHSASLGRRPSSAIALVEAVKPLLGVSSPIGTLDVVAGVRIGVADDAGAIRVVASVDTSAFGTPVVSTVGRLVAGASATLRVGAGPPSFALGLFAGLDGPGPDTERRRAVHVTIGDGLRVVLRPPTGADIALYPAGPGLAAAAVDQVVGQALPFVLDTLAAQTGNDLAGDVGRLVATLGDALGLRDDTTSFVYERLRDWAQDPVASLQAASTDLLAAAVTTLAPLLDDVLPADVSATSANGALRVIAGPVELTWRPSPFRIEVAASATTLPGIGAAAAAIALTEAGIDALTMTVGPVPVPIGPVELRPLLSVGAGASPPSGRLVALGLDVDGTRQFVARWLLDTATLELAVQSGDDVDTTLDAVAAALIEAVASLAASIALATPEVQALLDTTIPSGATTTTIAELLEGVVLSGGTLDTGLFQLAALTRRVVRLIDNLAAANLKLEIEGLTVGLGHDPSGVAGITLSLVDRFELPTGGDITLAIEVDDEWIEPRPPSAGLTLGLVKLAGTAITFAPSLTVSGVGLRILRTNGPLLDAGLTIESVALHTFASVSAAQRSGGVQLQLSNLAVSPGGATGGNAIASGIMSDTGSQKPKPSFSPALAIQKHGTNPVAVSLRAGPGDGPWFVAIQKGFGPLYIEQVGLAVAMPSKRVESIGLVLDARVSLFGLTAAVDDLSVTYFVSKGSFFEARNWEVDLRGLAIAAEIGPLSIAGGLLKSGTGDDIEYLGMLLGRFGVYGLTIYGGYGKRAGVVSFFAIGAVVGPIGGPPAFFVTGIGGGFGINRRLVVPTDLSQFGNYPLIQALDPGATPPSDPMAQLRQLGQFFPMQPGTFWFAAGISFNSFALVDGVAVVAMQFGDGFEISLLGLARMALPRPQVAVVSIELALVARISSKEGVVWVQGQLTDNSWLLYPDVRLTGGFAFVVWFAGPHRGEFVLSIGGFHPDFHRDGYPEVPRLGLQWRFGPVTVKGGSYFALTSEAVMVGVDVQASASFGWAWAKASFGAHGIVFFDPFRFEVFAYARVSAGVTIDTWFGDISFSISVGARIKVEGPDFRGTVTVEVGPCDVTLSFGSKTNNATPALGAAEFVPKYLEEAGTGVARAITSIMSAGARGPGPAADGREQPTPDGSVARPFVVTAEFSMVVTTLVPATRLAAGGAPIAHPPTRALGIAPMRVTSIDPVLTLAWQRAGGVAEPWPFIAAARPFGSFPVGVWGKPQDPGSPAVPEGEVIDALNEVALTAVATLSPAGPAIDARRLDPPGPRRPLPFLRSSGAQRTAVVNAGRRLERLVDDAVATVRAPILAASWRSGAGASPIELATFAGHRLTPPRVTSLGDHLAPVDNTVVPTKAGDVPAPTVDATVYAPVALAVLGSGSAVAEGQWPGTTVSDRPRVRRVTPPSLPALRGTPSPARLVLAEGGAQPGGRTVVPAGAPAATRAARTAPAVVARRGSAGLDRLAAITAGFSGDDRALGSRLRAGETAVLALPNARRDVLDGDRPALTVRGCPARLAIIGDGGDVLADEIVSNVDRDVPAGAERLVVAAIGERAAPASVAGWHAAMELPYAGWSTAICPGAVLRADGTTVARHRARGHAGFVEAAELVAGRTTVTTRFAEPVDVLLVAIDDPAPDTSDPVERRLLFGVDGADQGVDASGAPAAPAVVAAGNRSILAYRITPQLDATGRPAVVSVTVASGANWHVVGVLGARGDPATVAAGVAAKGFDAALGTLTPPGTGDVEIGWRTAPGAEPAGQRVRSPLAVPNAAFAQPKAARGRRASPRRGQARRGGRGRGR